MRKARNFSSCAGQNLQLFSDIGLAQGLRSRARRKALTSSGRDTRMSTGNWISDWNPEDQKFWESKGKWIARRNLIWSIFAEHLGFSIWLIWSIVATKLPQAGFHYTT